MVDRRGQHESASSADGRSCTRASLEEFDAACQRPAPPDVRALRGPTLPLTGRWDRDSLRDWPFFAQLSSSPLLRSFHHQSRVNFEKSTRYHGIMIGIIMNWVSCLVLLSSGRSHCLTNTELLEGQLFFDLRGRIMNEAPTPLGGLASSYRYRDPRVRPGLL